MHDANYLKWTITMSVERNLGLVCFCRTSVYDWSIKLALLPQPIRCKIKTKNVLVARVFPRFNHFSHFYFEFSSERCFQFLAVVITFILVLRHSNEKRSSALWLYIVEQNFLVSCLQMLGNQHQEADLSVKKKFWLLNRLTCTASGNKTSNIFNRMGTWLNTRPKCRWVGFSMSLYLFLYW